MKKNSTSKTNKIKRKNSFTLKILICIIIIGMSIISSYDNINKIRLKRKEKKNLTLQLEKLKEKETILTDDVDKLKNPEYAARYAREKYFYSKNGEKILKID